MKTNTSRLLLIVFFLFSQTTSLKAQFIEEYQGNIDGLYNNASDWGDFDNDGDLDLIITGQIENTNYSESITKIFENTGSGFTEVYPESIIGVSKGTVKWGDYDNDNDLDILIAGSLTTKIYQNTGSGFVEVFKGKLFGMDYCDGDWGDFDNDGDLDILLVGYYMTFQYDPKTQIFENTDSGFTEVLNQNISDINYGHINWGDYDNDGDLDFLIAGISNYSTLTTFIYKNTNDIFTETLTNSFSGVVNGSSDWGDYDNDGDLDLIITGSTASYSGDPITKIYNNTGTDFVEVYSGQVTNIKGNAVWGDYDNDGDLDILLSGSSISGSVTKIYNNNGDGFDEVYSGTLDNVTDGSIAWLDYNNDGSLDVFVSGNTGSAVVVKFYKNELGNSNTKPTSPTNLLSQQQNSYTILKWDQSSDTETPQAGLSYNIYIYEENETKYSLSPNAFVVGETNNGKRLVNGFGRIRWSADGYKILLPACGKKYYWSVQAVDGSLQGSPFAEEEEFIVSVPDFPKIYGATEINVKGFTLSWNLSCATDYYLDIATDSEFTSMVTNYKNKSLGNIDKYTIDDLSDDVTYYCRIKAENTNGQTSYSDVFKVRTGVFEELEEKKFKAIISGKAKIQWKDFDLDGDVDLLMNGHNQMDTSYSAYMYVNDGSQFNKIEAAFLYNDFGGFGDWGDFNLDNQIDLIFVNNIDGKSDTYIYENSENTFKEVYEGLIINEVYEGSISWADYNNDGALDFVITGYHDGGLISKIYKNTRAGFVEVLEGSIEPVSNSSIDWGDYDNDGDADILLTGESKDGKITKIYQNNITSFAEVHSGVIDGVSGGTATWVDYNSDGNLDVFVAGNGVSDNIAKLYQNSGSGFVEVFEGNFSNDGYRRSSWGDFDNDGDLDLLLTGNTPKLYLNKGNSFTEIYNEYFGKLWGGTSDWGDYDNDGDLDLVVTGLEGYKAYAKLFKNNIEIANQPPVAPENSSSTISGASVVFTWDKSTDNETLQDGLSYSIFVYKDGAKSKSRKLVVKAEEIQYCEDGYSILNLPEGQYYWKVQAFDTGLQSGEFSEEKSFIIGASSGVTYYESESICDGESYTFGTQELSVEGEYTETFKATDGSDSTVVLSLTINPTYNLTETVEINSGESYTFPDGNIQNNITSQVIYISNLQTVFGCDSIIETTVNVGDTEICYSSESVTVCSGSDYTFPDGTTQDDITSQVVYESYIELADECDKIIETTVNVNPTDLTNLTETICQGESITIAYGLFSYTGLYGITLKNEFGCDSVIKLDLTVVDLKVNLGSDVSINLDDTLVLDAGEDFETYYWNTEESSQTIEIDGEIGIGAHIYNVRVTDINSCVASDTIIITVNSLTDIGSIHNLEGRVKVYPNPTSDKLNIEFVENTEAIEISLYDIIGNLLLQKEMKPQETKRTIQIPGENGVYFIRIRSEYSSKTYKIIKN